MLYIKNLPRWERMLRLGTGATMVAYALLHMSSPLGWTVLAGGTGMALTGVFGFCPACALAGRRLARRAGQGPMRADR